MKFWRLKTHSYNLYLQLLKVYLCPSEHSLRHLWYARRRSESCADDSYLRTLFIYFDHNHIRFPKTHTLTLLNCIMLRFVFLYWFCIDFAPQMRSHISHKQGEKLYQGPEFCRQSVSISIRPRYLHRWVTAQGEVQYTNPSLTRSFSPESLTRAFSSSGDSCAVIQIQLSPVETHHKHSQTISLLDSARGTSDNMHTITLRKLDIKLKALKITMSDSLNTCWRPMKRVLRRSESDAAAMKVF